MSTRNFTIDHIKAIACLLIVGHHLAFYGPMSDVLRPVLPDFLSWMDEYARMAVQVFLVLGGFLAAGVLAPQGHATPIALWPVLSKRFVRLSLPYSAALVMAIVVNETVRGLGFTHDSVSETPSALGLLAHLLLLHSITGHESLSAGLWYVAIDFQLFALSVLWLWLCHRANLGACCGPMGISVLTAASLWVWNLNADLDVWGVYFMGAYGLGMMAWWAIHCPYRRQRMFWIGLMALLGVSALALQWRDRIAVAAACALLLAIGGNVRWPDTVRNFQMAPLSWMGQRSYSIFLIHFPMCLLVNAELQHTWPSSIIANCLGILMAFLLSIAAGAALYECTENTRASWKHLRHWHVGVLSTGATAVLLQWL